MAKFDPFLSLDCARVEGVGIKFCHLAPMRQGPPRGLRRAQRVLPENALHERHALLIHDILGVPEKATYYNNNNSKARYKYTAPQKEFS